MQPIKSYNVKVTLAAMCLWLMNVNTSLYGQDPSFSQFFSSPLNINPALTANIDADWRTILNMRNQWLGPASPYVTGTISFDSKIFQNKITNVSENNFLGAGAMLMTDYAMAGTAKSNYGSLNLSYNVKLSEEEPTQRLALGFGIAYANKRIDVNRLDFQDQFTGSGFNINLPSGESALSEMKAYLSLNTGVTYNYSTELSNLAVGIAAYHLNKPKQTFLQDETQVLPIRKVAHANFDTYLNDRVVLNTNAIYQRQSSASYFSAGAALGYDVGSEEKTMVNAGLWYWSQNAVIPYCGFSYQAFQVGLSYDITISKLSEASKKPGTWELSVIIRGVRESVAGIPCPWR